MNVILFLACFLARFRSLSLSLFLSVSLSEKTSRSPFVPFQVDKNVDLAAQVFMVVYAATEKNINN